MRIIRVAFALLLVSVAGLVMGCEGLSSALSPPSSSYPADITARIYVTSTLRVGFGDAEQATVTPRVGNVLWIANIYAKNKSYPKPMLGTYAEWAIKAGNNSYILPNAMRVLRYEPMMNAEVGQTKGMKTAFEVPSSLSIEDAQLVYTGQQPYSYGTLVDGGRVAAYDFDANRPMAVSARTGNVATVERIWAGTVPSPFIMVELKPTSSAVAGKKYIVDLYEKGKLRASKTVTFNQPQINVSDMVPVSFPATKAEGDAYMWQDISHIFSVKVHE